MICPCPRCGCPLALILFQVPECPSPRCELYNEGRMRNLSRPGYIKLLLWLRKRELAEAGA